MVVSPSSLIRSLDIKPTATWDIILRFLQRQMPADVDTGLNFIDMRDVARRHLLALEKGRSGPRYILGHQNLSLKQLLEILSEITGLKAPQISVPAFLPLSVVCVEEKILAPIGKTPRIPIDGVRMAQQPMYYDASKAVRELSLPQSPVNVALKDTGDCFVSNGYVK